MAHTLVRPLGNGGSLDHWRLGRLHEEPFDVPFERMTGDMDARFFLSQHKNYIPHEYPCRRIFAERFRARHPEPVAAFEPTSRWFPFGADRVDLSGFWFRATRVETDARTGLRTKGARFAWCSRPAVPQSCPSMVRSGSGWRPTSAICRARRR